jgi:hypothetical protein
MSPRTDRYVATTTLSILFQLIAGGWLWLYTTVRDGGGLQFGSGLAIFSLCGAALLCALDGLHRVGGRQRLLAAALAVFPAFVLLAFLYLLIRVRLAS